MTPEQQARQEIDKQLAACGWLVQNHKAMNIMAGPGVAVREFPLRTGFADYLLYVDGKVIGLIEAKPEGHTLTGVEIQSSKYTLGLPDPVPHYRKPLPFAYESTGTVTQFTNSLEPDFRSREVFTFHSPDELLRLVKLETQVRANLRTIPPVEDERLWRVQVEAVANLEASLALNRPRALIQMATGSGNSPPSARDDEFFELKIAIAPTAEQQRISEKLEELLSDLDASIAALERARANLKRYRAAVLKAAVEGKLTADWRNGHPNLEPAAKLLEQILVERRNKWEAAQLERYAARGKLPSRDWKAKYIQGAEVDSSGLPALPRGWCWATMDQLAYSVRNGLADKPAIQPPGFPMLRINAVRPMSTDLAEIRYLDRPREDVAEYFLSSGDLLFTRYNGSIELLGVAGLVRNCEQEVLHPDKLIRVKVALTIPLPEYLEIVSNAGVSRRHIASKARTTAGQTGISGKDIKEMPVPLCPLDEQARVLAEVEARLSVASKAASEIDIGLMRAQRLRQAILKRAFEGKLVPQDPNDEPASVLLERIRAARASGESPRKATQPHKGKRDLHQRVAETGNTGTGVKKKPAKRNVFAELQEGFDALKRERDA